MRQRLAFAWIASTIVAVIVGMLCAPKGKPCPVCPTGVSYPASTAPIEVTMQRGGITLTIIASPSDLFMTADPGDGRRIIIAPLPIH